MANILVTYAATEINGQLLDLGFYQGFNKALAENGNNVMRLFTNRFVEKSWAGSNRLVHFVEKDALIEDLKKFSPDLIISFNFSSIEGLDKVFSCPFLVMEADLYHYYNDKEYLSKNQDRFIFVNTGEKMQKATIEGLSLSPSSKCEIMRYGTSVQALDKNFNSNITFIGTPFSTSLQTLQKFYNYSGNDFYKTLSETEVMTTESARIRIRVLDEMADMGLTLYGNDSWKYLAPYFLKLANALQNEVVYSVEDYERIYNSSKICLNISHKQAIDGFPWRVMDIMASNGCLMTNPNKGISEFTKGYVDIPTYETISEAKALASKILSDEHWRRDIVRNAQKCIEDKGRWDDKIKRIQEFSGIPLLNKTRGNMEINSLEAENYLTVPYKIILHTQNALVKIIPSSLHPVCYQTLKALNMPVSSKAAVYAKDKKKAYG